MSVTSASPLSFFGFKKTKGDATGTQGMLSVPTSYRVLHFASAADYDTDWNVANPTHPTFYIHSETTPATDYISLDHDATDGTLNVASGNLKLALDGTDELTLTTAALSPTTSDGNALGTTALMWADLFLASGGVLNFNNGNMTITHSAASLALAGGTVLLTTATGGLGYGTGAGGTVTQATNKSTGVTLNTVTGIITMNAASLAADVTVAFTLTDSAIAATDAVVVLHESGGTIGAYSFGSTAAAGSVVISVHNNTPAALAEAIVLRFTVIKSVNA